MASTISGLVFALFGGCLFWGGIRSAAWLGQHLESVMEAAEASGDMDAIHNAQIEQEEPEGGCLIFILVIIGAGLVIYGLGGVFHFWDTWQPIVASLNDPYW